MTKNEFRDNVVRLFADRESALPEAPIAVPAASPELPPVPSPGSAIDLAGRPRLIMTFGAGRSGKSTLLRWAVERWQNLNTTDEVVLVTTDLRRPTLKEFFPGTVVPKSVSGSDAWLASALTALIDARQTAVIDFGADSTLLPLLGEIPDLQQVMTGAGIEPVVFYLLTPRVADLSVLIGMERAGFQPAATGLVLNMGTMMSDNPEVEFGRLRQHSAYRDAIGRGAVELWMPKLFAAKPVEERRIGFRHALDLPANNPLALGLFDRSRVAHWLDAMDKAFLPVASWLP